MFRPFESWIVTVLLITSLVSLPVIYRSRPSSGKLNCVVILPIIVSLESGRMPIYSIPHSATLFVFVVGPIQ